jgi:putative aminopeptidase FrvX
VHARRTSAEAFNVTATVAGRDRSLPPLVIMTPRSGWYRCASERGGGIVCWLEIMARFRSTRPERDMHFVATTGHELGHLGLRAYLRSRPGLVAGSVGWIHLGANLGASVARTRPGEGNTTQASDDRMEQVLLAALDASGIPVHLRRPAGSSATGEAEIIHQGGGRYVSAIGRNALFHHIDDKGTDVVDPRAIAGFADAFATVAESLSASAVR